MLRTMAVGIMWGVLVRVCFGGMVTLNMVNLEVYCDCMPGETMNQGPPPLDPAVSPFV